MSPSYKVASWSALYRGLSRNTADELQGTRSEKSSQGAILVQPKQREVGCICCPVQCNNEGGRGGGIVGKRGRKSGEKKGKSVSSNIPIIYGATRKDR